MAELADAADPEPAALERGGSLPPSGIQIALLLLILLAAFLVRAWYGHHDPTPRRFFDEQFALENAGRILLAGDLKPANGFHPSLSYLPQVAVLGALQGAAELGRVERLEPLGPQPVIERWQRPDHYPFTPTAYRAGRLMQALLGTLAVALTYALGRLLGGPVTGLVAAALAAVAPQLVRQSAIINEDAGLVVTVLGATLAAAVAGAERTLRSYLVAGIAVGLACSAKFNGAAAAWPLIAVTLAQRRDARAWGRLAAAGGVAILAFLAVTPWVLTDFALYRTDFARTLSNYDSKATMAGWSHPGVFLSGLTSVVEPAFLGPVSGAVALLGVLLVARRTIAAPTAGIRAAAQAILGYVVGYPLLYALATRNVSRHNWLPLLPLMAVAAGLVVSEGARWLGSRPRVRASWRHVPAAAAALLAVALAVPAARLTYRWIVPDTAALAARRLATHLQPLAGRLVVTERELRRIGTTAPGGLVPAVLNAGSRGSARGAFPETADALVLRRDHADGSPDLRQLAARGRLVEVIAPRLGLRRGPALSIYVMGWQPAGERSRITLACVRSKGWVGTIESPPADVISLAVWPRRSAARRAPPESVRIGGHPTRLWRAHLARRRTLLYSEKVDLATVGGRRTVEIQARCRIGEKLSADVLGWRAGTPRTEARRTGDG